MDFWDLTKVIIRRWWVAAPVLALTAVAALWAHATVQPDYTQTAYVQLVLPRGTVDVPGELSQADRNRWLGLGLTALGTAASVDITQASAAQDLALHGFSAAFTVNVDTQTPVATIVVTSSDKQMAVATANELVRRYMESVANLQTQYNVVSSDIITCTRLGSEVNVEVKDGNVKRALIVVIGLGVALAVGLTIAVDTLIRRRRRGPVEYAMTPAQVTPAIAPTPTGLDAIAALPHPVPSYKTPPPGAREAQQLEQAAGPAAVEDENSSADSTVLLPLGLMSRRGRER